MDGQHTLIDLEGYQLRAGQARVPLTGKERAVLDLLLRKRGSAVSREEILDGVWGRDSSVGHSNVDNIVARLRAKFGLFDGGAPRISTVRGVGYRWSAAS